ncbi:MAG: ribokinase [Chloroflexi bacterium]|nr:ribokinase [Chloroflexota bacterium]
MHKVTVFGSFVVDLMARTPYLPAPGETVKGSLFRQGPGGKGFNQGIAAHKAGADVNMVTKIGRDSMAMIATDAMDAVGMPKDHLCRSDTDATGIALIMVDENTSQNKIVIVPGACATINDADITEATDCIVESKYLLLQLEVNQDANEKVARIAKQHGVKVIVNTAPYQDIMSDEFLNGCWLVTPNEVEAEAMTGIVIDGIESADRAAEVIRSKGVSQVLITLGGRGVYVNMDGVSEIVPAYRVRAIDTTGAGDAFNGGLLCALAENKSLPEAARFANAVAAISVTRLGTTPAMPARSEVDEFIRAHNE